MSGLLGIGGIWERQENIRDKRIEDLKTRMQNSKYRTVEISVSSSDTRLTVQEVLMEYEDMGYRTVSMTSYVEQSGPVILVVFEKNE